MTIEIAHGVGPAKLDIAYERLGDPMQPPLLLIMGLGAQLIAWPDGFCDELVRGGMHVIRFDNRDVGHSTHMTSAPMPNYPAALGGDFSSVTYRLSDMAADAAGLLDALDIASAHVVGASLGGFVAQTLAIEHRGRVRTLTSMMSSTGDRTVGQPHPETMKIFTAGVPTNREEAIASGQAGARVIGSPSYPPDPAQVAERTGRAFDRAFDPLGMARQAIAVLASGDRTAGLRALEIPALVIHGASDPLVDLSGGRATAEALRAELLVIEGMGHDLPRALWPQIAAKILTRVASGPAA
jgi:pimeloyl-ACP methyl ester carboxylesterase